MKTKMEKNKQCWVALLAHGWKLLAWPKDIMARSAHATVRDASARLGQSLWALPMDWWSGQGKTTGQGTRKGRALRRARIVGQELTIRQFDSEG
jgi:hypothetical protein